MRYVLSLCLVFALAACARISGEVQSFSALTETNLSQKIFVKPAHDKHQSSLEFQSYKSKLEQKLSDQGFTIVQTIEDTDLIARFDYGVDDGTTIVETTPNVTIGGSVGSGGGGHIGTRYRIPIYTGSSSSRAYESFTRKITLDIIKADTYSQESAQKVLYEGTLLSKGRCGILSEVMDEMLTLLFEKFPDQNGRVSAELEAEC